MTFFTEISQLRYAKHIFKCSVSSVSWQDFISTIKEKSGSHLCKRPWNLLNLHQAEEVPDILSRPLARKRSMIRSNWLLAEEMQMIKDLPPWKINIAHENIPFQKETSLPTIIFRFHINLPGCTWSTLSEWFVLPEVNLTLLDHTFFLQKGGSSAKMTLMYFIEICSGIRKFKNVPYSLCPFLGGFKHDHQGLKMIGIHLFFWCLPGAHSLQTLQSEAEGLRRMPWPLDPKTTKNEGF